MVSSVLPGDVAICGDLNELELDVLACGDRDVQEPVGIVRIKHRSERRIEGRTPVAEFDCVAGEEDVVAWAGRCRVVHREGDRNQLCCEYGELEGVRECSLVVDQLHGIDSASDVWHGEGG